MFGTINNPLGPGGFGIAAYSGSQRGEGLILILSTMVRMTIVIAALYAFWNILSAGYGFLNAGGDQKVIMKSWEKIWQSLVGLLIVAGSFVLSVVVGYLIFGWQNAFILIEPRIFTP